ncbi:serine/threonine-protein kinase [Ralstonia solanacearum]|uniref:serine/threonine-protein kinase n=1 Tax=Ralstonia solanacearum TaxID=305 RepID=UPI0009BC474D|nr:serine/threonine-protein kinase [Ralstonia solanacearum]MCL9824594.1 serine/threonine protein kinase [Ralstonia solanacearum]MCL9830029.1 serine/threonine protein kinase [Ralstonia solanacearum]MCL9834810.1 serine/threonine protein kinase [Ralstonia solanacearum]
MGDIHFCVDKHLQRDVVLKIIKDGEEERRLLDEQRALIRLRSKHVVQLFDVISLEDRGGKTALVLEFIPGKDLQIGQYVPGDEYMKILWQIACGLADIHTAGIIHRDIKPQNIRLDGNGVVKIIDFGLARRHGHDAHTKSIIGTLGFMAPELWGGSTISFDAAIDVYAFGVTALALLNVPAPSEIFERPPQPVRAGALAALRGSLPDALVTIIEQCLSHKPSDRPTMRSVEEVLRLHLLYGKHRALMVMGGKAHELSASSKKVTLTYGVIGSIEIGYDGFRFSVLAFSGTVSINNEPVGVGSVMPECCVITFGGHPVRSFVTFDVSNPEVTP